MGKVPKSASNPGVQQSGKQASKINSLHTPAPPTPSLTRSPNIHAFIPNQSKSEWMNSRERSKRRQERGRTSSTSAEAQTQAAEGPALPADAGRPEDLDTSLLSRVPAPTATNSPLV